MSELSDPDRRVLVVVDMERYSGRDNVLQYRAQRALRDVLHRACDDLGFDRSGWLVQQAGDGELAILPAATSERAVVTQLTPTLDRLLREYNRGLAPEARVRLRVAVHEGLVHLDGAMGYPGDAVVTVGRLADAPQIRAALRAFPGAAVALIVSDRVYQDVVCHYHDLRPEQFRRITVSIPDKKFDAVGWIHVPGENAASAHFDTDQRGQDSPDAGRPYERPLGSVGAAPTQPVTPAPQPAGGGQVFHNITSNGPTAFGNGNSVTSSSYHDDHGPYRLSR